MLQLSIFLLFMIDLLSIFAHLHGEKILDVRESRTGLARNHGDLRETAFNMPSKNTRLETSGTERAGTLEKCCDKIGRWISRNICKKLFQTEKEKCHCRHCNNGAETQAIGTSGILDDKSDGSHAHVKAKDRAGRASGDSAEGVAPVVVKPPGDSVSSIRFSKSQTAAQETVLQTRPQSVSGKVQQHDARRKRTYRAKKAQSRRPKTTGKSADRCCECCKRGAVVCSKVCFLATCCCLSIPCLITDGCCCCQPPKTRIRTKV